MWQNWEQEYKPEMQLHNYLFWDMDVERLDYTQHRTLVVQRVIERGSSEDFLAMFKLYGGVKNVRKIIKEIPYLSERNISFVCIFFNLKKEELRCYTRKLLREQLLNC